MEPQATSRRPTLWHSQPISWRSTPPPVAILLWRPPLSPSQQSLARSQETLQLVIDQAGKVHSAELVFPNEDPELMNATKNWKFIPAIKDGQPVAYTMKLDVSPYQ